MTTEECHVNIQVLLPGVKKEFFHRVFQGSRPCQQLDLELLTSGSVKEDISFVYTNLVSGPLLQQPW